jgi:ATP-dependent Clp protease adaptor protein ClpS
MYYTEKNSINYSMENKTHKIVLFNDDKHDFLYIIACLIKFCNHDPHQAEQCALIAHSKGSVDIASGNFIDMYEMSNALENMEVTTEVEEYV